MLFRSQDKSKKILSSVGENNILIEGDNYHALTALNFIAKESIDIVYIDPPYNTGHEDFIYNDKFVNEEDKEIGLITFYGAQLRLLRQLQGKYSGKLTLKPSSVDRFQGMERNVVIVSLVRSNCIAENEKQAPDYRVYKDLGYRKQTDFGFAKSPDRKSVV